MPTSELEEEDFAVILEPCDAADSFLVRKGAVPYLEYSTSLDPSRGREKEWGELK